MRITLISILLFICFHSNGQRDTILVYYPEGQLRSVVPKLNGKPHGQSKSWYENGNIRYVNDYENGEQIKTIMFYEDGRKSNYIHYYKWKTKIKMWHPNGNLWTLSKSKYLRSIEKEYDSTGVLLHKTLEKNGSLLSCVSSRHSNASVTTDYKDGSCVCSWGDVFCRNGIFVDEKGRDLLTNYSYTRLDYFPDGRRKRETTWNKDIKQYIIREWNAYGELVH